MSIAVPRKLTEEVAAPADAAACSLTAMAAAVMAVFVEGMEVGK